MRKAWGENRLRGHTAPLIRARLVVQVHPGPPLSYFLFYARKGSPHLRGGRLRRWRRRRWRRREFGVVHRHVLLKLFDLDRKPVAGPREDPTEGHFYAICIAIIRIVNLRRIPAKRCFAVPDEAQQETRFFVQIKAQRRLAFGAPDNQVSVAAIDFFTGINAEFLVKRFQMRRQIKVGINAGSVVLGGRHHVHVPWNTEPSPLSIKGSDAVAALEVHDWEAL